ncbi:MAG: molybdenum cofactor biosynthesis protein MoaE [Bacteroidales bacterium]
MKMSQSNYLINGPIGPDRIAAETISRGADPDNGAYSLFLGRVRSDLSGSSLVEAIEYSAYPEMVDKVMDGLRAELKSRYPFLTGLRVLHSTGLVRAGEVSLLVMVAGRHRTQIFEALAACVELIKERLPIWKKEVMADGSSRWIE